MLAPHKLLVAASSLLLCFGASACSEREGLLVPVQAGDVLLGTEGFAVLGASLTGSFGGVNVTGPANVTVYSADPSFFDLQLTTPDGRALLSLSGSGLSGFGPPPSVSLGMACTGKDAYSFENEVAGQVISTDLETQPGAGEGPALHTLSSSLELGDQEAPVEVELQLATAT